ncbi:MAG TPA: polysaccharide deacetylase family protein [Ohtaekwangia sp.]
MKNYALLLIVILSCAGQSTSSPEENADYINNGKEVTCFVYHRFGDSRYPTTNVPVSDFEAHLKWLQKNGYRMITFSEAIAYLKSDEPIQKTAVITVDDAYKSFFKNGLPLLKKYNYPSTLFINTETVGGGDYMDWASLEAAMKSKVEIGNHTHTHNYFLNEDAATRYKTFEDEIKLSQTIIEKNLNITPVVFSYPYGEFDLPMKEIAKKLGFQAAAAQNSGVLYSGGDLFMCPRFPMSESYSAINKFIEKASSGPLKVLKASPESFMSPPDKRPLLTLDIDNTDLVLKRIQCFVQGGECDLRVLETKDNKTTLTVQAIKPMTSKRRTLYTVTIPDKKGRWHWYSHLWINEKKKE